MGAVETSFDEMHSIFDIGGSKGLTEYSVEKIPKIAITRDNDVDESGERVSCSVCLQVIGINGESGVFIRSFGHTACLLING